MSAPTFPYTTSSAVAKLVYQLIPGGIHEFGIDTIPTEAALGYYINYVSSLIDMAFQEAGYYLPLEAISGEEWISSQSYFVEYLASMGVAALIGDSLRPTAGMGPLGETAPGNVFRTQFNTWMASIRSGVMGFRANYRVGTPAESFILSDRSPMWLDLDSEYSSSVDVAGFWNSAVLRNIELQVEQDFVGYPYPYVQRWR